MTFPSTWPRPERRVLEARWARLEPLDASAHAAALSAADVAGDADTWQWLPYGPWASAEDHAAWLADQARDDDPLFFTVLVDGRAVGVATLMAIVPEHGRIEIGHVWFSRELQRTPASTEAIFLLASYAMDDLGYRRLEWKTNALNAPSRRAAERLGFTFEGVFRQHQVIKGENRDTAWFSLLDSEWPAARAGLEAWLDPANFEDGGGAQRRRLEDVRAEAG